MENSDQNVKDIEQIYQVLQQLNIPATFDNMTKLLYCLQLLSVIKGRLTGTKPAEVDQNATDRNE